MSLPEVEPSQPRTNRDYRRLDRLSLLLVPGVGADEAAIGAVFHKDVVVLEVVQEELIRQSIRPKSGETTTYA